MGDHGLKAVLDPVSRRHRRANRQVNRRIERRLPNVLKDSRAGRPDGAMVLISAGDGEPLPQVPDFGVNCRPAGAASTSS
jgi:hypothetical protein